MKILVIAHGHPDLNIGGGEKAAYILFNSFRRTPGIEAFFLARADANPGISGCFTSAYPGRKNEYFLHTSLTDFFNLSCNRPETLRAFAEFLEAIQPDVIHFHHYVHIGIELLLVARSVIPKATIALTLHEYHAICNRDGQMVKAGSNRLCYSSNSLDCSRCFPERSGADFFLRETYIKRFLSEVDFFVTPSKFLRDRYITWGLPENKMVLLPYGTELSKLEAAPDLKNGELHNVFGFFGQINDYKGVDVLVSAIEVMTEYERKQVQVEIFGNLSSVLSEARRKILEDGFKDFRTTIKFNGPYQAEELARLMRRVHWVVVPSVWWENAPLVIDEAFGSRKPVLCSNIGGMAEKVRDGVDGFHFDVGNHRSLSRIMLKSASDRDTYNKMRAHIQPPIAIDEISAKHLELYKSVKNNLPINSEKRSPDLVA